MFRRFAQLFIVVSLVVGTIAIAWSGVSTSPEELDIARLTSNLETSARVEAAFVRSKRLGLYDIDIETSNGMVTLAGTVSSEIDRELAENIARDTNGVFQVDNHLDVDSASRPSEQAVAEEARVRDLETRADVRERLLSSQELGNKRLLVGVKDRVVRLSGVVESQSQKVEAEELVRSVDGVADVKSEIVVSGVEADRKEESAPPAALGRGRTRE